MKDSKFHTVFAVHFPLGDKSSVSVPDIHFDSSIRSGFSFHVGYFWGIVIWHRNSGKLYVTAYDMRVSSSRNDFCNLYNGRSPEALVTGRRAYLLLV